MSKSPWSQIRQATPEILVITRRGVRRITAWRRPLGRFLFQYLPEVLAVGSGVVVVTATWIIHPIAGLYVAGLMGLAAAGVVMWARRTT